MAAQLLTRNLYLAWQPRPFAPSLWSTMHIYICIRRQEGTQRRLMTTYNVLNYYMPLITFSPKWNQGERLLSPLTAGSLRSFPKFLSLCEQNSSSMARPPAVPAVAQVTSFTVRSTSRLALAAAQSAGFTCVRFEKLYNLRQVRPGECHTRVYTYVYTYTNSNMYCPWARAYVDLYSCIMAIGSSSNVVGMSGNVHCQALSNVIAVAIMNQQTTGSANATRQQNSSSTDLSF